MKKVLLFSLLFGVASLFTIACNDDDDDNDNPGTILAELNQNPNLTTLVDALEVAGLDQVFNGNQQQLTLFAPDNTAFANLLSSLGYTSLSQVPVDVLTDVLLNHVVAGEFKSGSLVPGYLPTLLTFAATTDIYVNLLVNLSGGVKVNDATVTTADVDASNGVIHIINKVMVPPTVVNHAVNNPDFSSLVAALTRPDLGIDYVSILSGPGPYTVFAPTNAAFSALLTELGVASLNDIPAATLNAVLQYHVANGNVRAENLTNGQIVNTLQGTTFTVNLTGGAKILDAQGRTSNIVATNVQGANGVVHAIDKVLLP